MSTVVTGQTQMPRAVKVVAWVYMVLGGLVALLGYYAVAAFMSEAWGSLVGGKPPDTSSFFLIMFVHIVLVVAGGVIIAAGLQLLHGDDGFRRLLRHVAAAVACMSGGISLVALLIALDPSQDWTGPGMTTALAAGVAALSFAVLAALLGSRGFRETMVSNWATHERPEAPFRVLLIAWPVIIAGGLEALAVLVAILASIPDMRNWHLHAADLWAAPLAIAGGALVIALIYWQLFGGIALLRLEEKGRRWLSNIWLLVLVGSGFWVVQIVFGWLAPYLRASQWHVIAGLAPMQPGENPATFVAEFVVALVALRLLRSRTVTGAIAEAEALRQTEKTPPPTPAKADGTPPPRTPPLPHA